MSLEEVLVLFAMSTSWQLLIHWPSVFQKYSRTVRYTVLMYVEQGIPYKVLRLSCMSEKDR